MTEWWTYRLSDFLLFSPRTYYRLFELYNADVWPGHLLALGVGLGLLWCVTAGQGRPWAVPVICAMLAGSWLWVAWAFHLQRYATINWAAGWFAAAFAAQGLLLLLVGMIHGGRLKVRCARAWPGRIGVAMLAFALLAQPGLGQLFGRPWTQAELFGLAPDPTVIGSMGLIMLLQPRHDAWLPSRWLPWLAWMPRLLWPVPLLWCLVGGATLWALQSPLALLLPGAALLALWAIRASWTRRQRSPLR